MGPSWFLSRSSIQVQDWPVHQASFTKQIADRHSRPLHSRSRLPPVISHPAKGRQTSCSPFPSFPSALARFSRPQKADPARPGPVSLPAESPLSLLRSLASKPLAPPLSSTSLSRPLPLSRPGGAYRPERGRKKRELSIHHHRTNNKQPLTSPDTHVTSIL